MDLGCAIRLRQAQPERGVNLTRLEPYSSLRAERSNPGQFALRRTCALPQAPLTLSLSKGGSRCAIRLRQAQPERGALPCGSGNNHPVSVRPEEPVKPQAELASRRTACNAVVRDGPSTSGFSASSPRTGFRDGYSAEASPAAASRAALRSLNHITSRAPSNSSISGTSSSNCETTSGGVTTAARIAMPTIT